MASAAKGDVAAVEAELSRQPELARTSNETGDTALHQAEVESSCTPMSQAARDEELAALLGAHGGRQQAASDRDRAQRLVVAGRLDEAENRVITTFRATLRGSGRSLSSASATHGFPV